mmetsp:Transcript_26210/g.56211  ORF Transcript_26210/g.56211 Transcript_26210/m.56211 type:complete len:94 (+) Transcript_26210:1594-1875(+)
MIECVRAGYESALLLFRAEAAVKQANSRIDSSMQIIEPNARLWFFFQFVSVVLDPEHTRCMKSSNPTCTGIKVCGVFSKNHGTEDRSKIDSQQ